jgi:hypothetical protein
VSENGRLSVAKVEGNSPWNNLMNIKEKQVFL